MSPLGHKPSYYLRLFERLQCEVKQPLSLLPGERVSSARTSHSFVTIRQYIQTMVDENPYTISSGVVAAVATAYLLFVLLMVVLFSS